MTFENQCDGEISDMEVPTQPEEDAAYASLQGGRRRLQDTPAFRCGAAVYSRGASPIPSCMSAPRSLDRVSFAAFTRATAGW